ncbi:peptidoglycan-binding protein LysM [Winogradskyella echinorum]|uniref:Peptidoglycan-binding protein LysM n=1 Tax=Winogradskyella echinorum TaxID=538189 RepID=A0ABR6Y5R4_9FLAO|nr:peptidoglycan-binding protein LysM [Winogradskyella echinorum]MBC3848051.1 peptidoglycan-binding protein LysM [Winogradskyella echinorum]MBC5752399.1 peptidoglycan-binding protein LysM [Winogradskyella echinorum]
MIKNRTKNVVLPFVFCFLIALALYPNSTLDPETYSTEGLELNYNISKDMAMVAEEHTTKQNMFTPHLGKSFEGFKEALAFKESRGNYFTVNTLGYLGKYQFGSETLKLIGIYKPNQFLYNPELQEKAFIANAERNKWVLRKDIKRFEGKQISGIKVTESGILAAAHLAGPGSVKKFLRSYGNNNSSDAYGSTVKHYMKKFSGYDTSVIVADKKARVTP